ncbi:MAG: SDR family oxidoreductase [Thermoleophilia bacterium]
MGRPGRLEGRIALVAESGDGIGRGTALRFAEEGASLVCVDADADAAAATAEAARAYGGEAVPIGADLTRAADCERVAAAARDAFGGLDVLYNNASLLVTGTVEDCSEEDWDRVFALNVKAIFLLTRACLPLLRARGGGSIVNLASSLALIGYPGLPAYSASKGAVRQLTKTLALDCAADGIRVNCICHGGIDDPLLHSLFDRAPDPAGALAGFLEGIPLGRLIPIEHMAAAALFLASDESGSTTGAEILVDGGQTAR